MHQAIITIISQHTKLFPRRHLQNGAHLATLFSTRQLHLAHFCPMQQKPKQWHRDPTPKVNFSINPAVPLTCLMM